MGPDSPGWLKKLKIISVLRRKSRIRKCLIALLLGVTVLGVSGCHTLSFYGQAFRGQYQIFANEESINKLIIDPRTPEHLRERFQLLEGLRAFAQAELKLPIDNHYRKYADLHRPFVVWNVEAAPEFSMRPKTWWYPLLGSLEYRGYFSKQGATNYARYLLAKGYDVSVGGVQAYSTLGWFKDPVLNTFIFERDADLAEIIFHELGHQRVFAHGDTDFNEAFATTVGEEGARRWLRAQGDKAALDAYLAHLQRNNQFVHLVMRTRRQLEALYGDTRNAQGKVIATRRNKDAPAQQLRRQKAQVMQEMKQQFAQLKQQWNGDAEYDWWFSHDINNAYLNSVAAYYDLVPSFEQILAANGGDLEKFYRAVERLAEMTKKERQEQLRALAPPESRIAISQ
jgi:predicted aminopeptidase